MIYCKTMLLTCSCWISFDYHGLSAYDLAHTSFNDVGCSPNHIGSHCLMWGLILLPQGVKVYYIYIYIFFCIKGINVIVVSFFLRGSRFFCYFYKFITYFIINQYRCISWAPHQTAVIKVTRFYTTQLSATRYLILLFEETSLWILAIQSRIRNDSEVTGFPCSPTSGRNMYIYPAVPLST